METLFQGWLPKALCSDIDGTLLNEHRNVSSRLVSAVTALPASIPFILASSRMPAAIRPLQQSLGREKSPTIAYNGGFVLPNAGSPPIISVTIDLELVKIISHLTLQWPVHLSLFHGDEWFASATDYWANREINNTKVTPVIAASTDVLAQWQDAGKSAHKIMCMGEELHIGELKKAIESSCSGLVQIFPTKTTYLEIAPIGISKADALDTVLINYFNCSIKDALTFGDGHNDLELIRDAGLGVAVENAIPEIKEVAKGLTAAGKNDGVAMVLEELIARLKELKVIGN